MISIRLETPCQPEVARLLEEADARSAGLYPEASRHGLGVDALAASGVRFFVARLNGRAVGCGGYLPVGGNVAELNRLFVTAAARGRGAGGSILRVAEAAATGAGVVLMQLETGVASKEALALYRRAGYRERAPFGSYNADPLCVFMEKHLIATADNFGG